MNHNEQQLVSILRNFGEEKCNGNEQFFTSFVAEMTSGQELIEITLYFIAPEISYEYRAINVELHDNLLNVRFFSLATKSSELYNVPISNEDYSPFRNKLNEIGEMSLFKAALEFLINQTLIKREYKTIPIREKIILGQAKIAILRNGEKINAGWKRFDGDYIVYYTGKGLREMWKPNMTEEELLRANILRQKEESELIQEGMIAKTLISEISDVI